MKVAITGAAGFLGGALAEGYERRGDDVVRLARPAFDLNDSATFGSIPDSLDVLIHAAAFVGEPKARDDKKTMWELNVQSVHELIQALRNRCRIGRVAFLSTGAVYGAQPQAVSLTSPPRPDTSYGASKLLGETLMQAAGWPLTVIRPYFPIGVKQRPPRLVPGLVRRIARGETVRLTAEEGWPEINPVAVEDFVRLSIEAIDAGTGAINIGGPERTTIRGLAEKIGSALGCKPAFEVAPGARTALLCEVPAYRNFMPLDKVIARVVQQADYLD